LCLKHFLKLSLFISFLIIFLSLSHFSTSFSFPSSIYTLSQTLSFYLCLLMSQFLKLSHFISFLVIFLALSHFSIPSSLPFSIPSIHFLTLPHIICPLMSQILSQTQSFLPLLSHHVSGSFSRLYLFLFSLFHLYTFSNYLILSAFSCLKHFLKLSHFISFLIIFLALSQFSIASSLSFPCSVYTLSQTTSYYLPSHVTISQNQSFLLLLSYLFWFFLTS
jgi:hypothetical protein